MSRNKTIVTQETPNLAGHPSVNLRKPDFEALIEQKGYNVYLERNYRCPCRSKDGGQQLSSCKNCGGSGYLFINKIKTRMVLHSMNVDTQFKEWSQENIGTVSITARDIDKLSTMDRITLIDAESEFNQVLYPKLLGTDLYAYTTYDIRDVRDVFLYMGDDVPLKRLKNITDYTFSYNKVILDPVLYNDLVNPTITIRYIHSPQFHVIDIPRETININVKVEGSDTSIQMPINAIGRRSHYVLDQENFVGDRVIDNSYLPSCDDPSYTVFQSMIKNSTFEDIFNELTDNQRNSLDEEILKVINEVGSIHEQNTDTYLAIGTPDETSAHEIRLFLDNPPAGYTDAQARAAISNSATGLSYNSSTGSFSLTSGYVIPTTVNVTSWNSKEPALGNPTVDGYILTSTTAGVRSWVAITSPLTAGDGINITSGVISLDISDYTAPGYIQLTTTGSNRIVLTSANGFHAEGSAFMDLISGGLLTVSTAYAQFSFVGGIDFFGGNDFTTHFTGATTFNTSNFSINATSGISLSAGSGNFTLSHGAGAFNLNSTTASLSGSYGTFLLSQTNGLTVTSSMGSIALDSNGLSISDVNGNSILSNSTDFTITSIGIAKINGVDISLTSTGSVSLVSQSGTLILSDGTHVANITFAGMSAHYSYNFPDKGGTFAMTSDISSLVTGVSSVFGRTGAVVAAIGDYTFAQIASKPTTLSGYGITDAYTQLLTGYSSGSGTISSSDSILSAIQKLNGNIALVTGAVVYQGLWNASTNSPSLSSGVGTKGYMYKVSVAGTTSLDGISQWNVGDQVIFDGTTWDKIDGVANEVLSVNGNVGAVPLTGTTNRITVNGSNVFDISSFYVGQASITTLGTIGTGVWNGSAIGDTYISSASTWNAKQSALTFGNLTETTSSVLTISGGTGSIIGSGLTIQVKLATSSVSGYLSSSDWTIFNNKASASDLTAYLPLGGGTMTGDTLYASSKGLKDANGKYLISFPTTVTSAVNYLTVSNAPTLNSVVIGVDGTDSNGSLNFTQKGSGNINFTGGSGNLIFTKSGTTALTIGSTITFGLPAQVNARNTLSDVPLTLRGFGTAGSYTQTGDLLQTQSFDGTTATVNSRVDKSGFNYSLKFSSDVITKTGTDIVGNNLIIEAGPGTGGGIQNTSESSSVIFKAPVILATGLSTAQTSTTIAELGWFNGGTTGAPVNGAALWMGGVTPSGSNFTILRSSSLYINAPSGGTVNLRVASADMLQVGNNFLSTGGTFSAVYRITNAGPNVTAHMMIDPAGSLVTGAAYGYSSADGFLFTQGNGTRRIAFAGIKGINLTSTAASEAGDLGFYTQLAGAAAALRMTIGGNVVTFASAPKLPSYTVAGVPSASTLGAGSLIYVSNESGGATPAFSDGTNWKRVSDLAIIS